MIHRARKIRVGESDSPEWQAPQDLTGSGLAVFPKEESGLRTEIGVTPAIQNDGGNVAPCIEPGGSKHSRELLPDAPLVLSKRRRQQLGATANSLFLR